MFWVAPSTEAEPGLLIACRRQRTTGGQTLTTAQVAASRPTQHTHTQLSTPVPTGVGDLPAYSSVSVSGDSGSTGNSATPSADSSSAAIGSPGSASTVAAASDSTTSATADT